MPDKSPDHPARPDAQIPDPTDISRALSNIAERSQRLIQEFIRRHPENVEPDTLDPLNIAGAFLEMTTRLMADPARLVEAQVSLWQDYVNLWQNTALRMMGEKAPPVVEPDKNDKRFRDEAWQNNELFDFIKQSYLLTARWIRSTVKDVEGLDEQSARKVDFYTRQFVDAMAPSNFVLTNPEVLRITAETGGENLIKGLEHLLSDLERGRGRLRISMTDENAFDIGRNVASTPGQVIFQNDLIQLIQYAPSTETVKHVPLLIIPPWINKYYILDLRENNSLVKWCVDQGFSVFVISWVNPDEHLAAKSFEDYMTEGPLAAIEAIKAQTHTESIHALGYCLGGTLLASTLAWLKARGQNKCVASATLLAALTDFSDPGEISVFIDDEQLEVLDSKMSRTGYLDGADMANSFNMLRSNELIWSFVVNNYLLGKEPFPFDLLYWNSDSTRMPASMHSFYLHNMYRENNLVKPGGITLKGTPINLRCVDTPVYMLSCREDHIAPWKATYTATHIFTGKVRFVLGASGHIAGVINPPAAGKYAYWTNGQKAKTPDDWLQKAKEHKGSWWTDWMTWLKPQSGEDVPARDPGQGPLTPLEPAPGQYVRIRAG
ncbi:class I poly(R)-hydroxyalkanoic acid synthase [Haematospirillum sp. H1815]|uniref:PHA/PHB synthase family protein n=1 Tax=Haematospirillum sp. H1815 TaxID=2723108 RepID=UPI001439FA8F|nr:class I poly(R)-hydroxyalkanoic acid synthase [Haematospirillum sp. H1815]NKD77170.1 class I poly(R)-hydroxyalkanoic acid synthase [Haematospirillum sp. H1815]